MNYLLKLLPTLFKTLPGANAVVGIGGVLALLAWFTDHGQTVVCFSYIQLGVFGVLLWAFLEANRKSPT